MVEKRNDLRQLKNINLMGSDNVLMVAAPNICIIFDLDFDSYLIDRVLPIVNLQNSNIQQKINFYDQ